MTAGPAPAVRRAAFALGANLGDRVATLQGAVDALAAAPGVRARAMSAVYETDPVGGPEQPAFLNAVLVVDTDLPADALLALGHEVEQRFGRVRAGRWGPRTLDVDLLAVGSELAGSPVAGAGSDGTAGLVLPHPRAHLRAFVLVPWADVDPDFVVPGRGAVAALLAGLPGPDLDGVRRRADVVLALPASPA